MKDNRTHPTFVERGTDRPLYVRRRGSDVVNGEYHVDHDLQGTVAHYSSTRAIDLPGLRERFERMRATPPAEASKNSPLLATERVELPRYFTLEPLEVSDLNTGGGRERGEGIDAADARRLVAGLNPEGYWPTPLAATSNPYSGDGSPTPAPGDYSRTRVGDATDTSPYLTDQPVVGISTGTYIENMAALIGYAVAQQPQR